MHRKDGLVGSNFVSVVRSQAYNALLIPEVSNNATLFILPTIFTHVPMVL